MRAMRRASVALKAAERGALLTQRLLAFSRKQALHLVRRRWRRYWRTSAS